MTNIKVAGQLAAAVLRLKDTHATDNSSIVFSHEVLAGVVVDIELEVQWLRGMHVAYVLLSVEGATEGRGEKGLRLSQSGQGKPCMNMKPSSVYWE